MNDLREVFEMVTKQTEPDLDSWKQQEERQRRASRNRKAAAIGLVAAIAAALVAIAVSRIPSSRQSPGGETVNPSVSPTSGVTLGLNTQDRIIVGLDGSVIGTVNGLPQDAFGLSLSPDGTTVAFVMNANGTNSIATMRIDGQGRQVLGLGTEPAISPDGREIAFVRDKDVYVMGTDGSGVRRLTTSPYVDESPQWSPDGSTIVYANLQKTTGNSGFTHSSVIMTIPSAGGSPTQISRNPDTDGEPSYSPDGSQIVFRRGFDIWVMNADGTGAHRIAQNTGGTADAPRWSPDGTKIAFTDYSGVWRAYIPLGVKNGDWPIEFVRVVDVATGRVSSVDHLAMATFWNAPQWLPSGDALLLNVVRKA